MISSNDNLAWFLAIKLKAISHIRTNNHYIYLKNNTTQLYFILGRSKLCSNFSSTHKDVSDIYRFPIRDESLTGRQPRSGSRMISRLPRTQVGRCGNTDIQAPPSNAHLSIKISSSKCLTSRHLRGTPTCQSKYNYDEKCYQQTNYKDWRNSISWFCATKLFIWIT